MGAPQLLAESTGRHGWPESLVAPIRRWGPPVRRREFWVVQALVLTIATGHGFIEASDELDLGPASFLPVSLFLIPVIYAALAFGARGAVPTALWCAALTMPNIAMFHDGLHMLAELWQIGLVVAVAFFVGHRADQERQAREEAEQRERERRSSEAKYRGLFDLAADSILLLDATGGILEANAAAAALFGRGPDQIRGRHIGELSPELTRLAGGNGGNGGDGVMGPLRLADDRTAVWIDPVRVPFRDAAGNLRTLVQLRNVTHQVDRQRLLEDYARQTLAAREEERRRVARELHDGPLQSLILLWRSLDQLGEAAAPEAAEALRESRRTAEAVASELRRFSRDLRPSVLDDLGLVPAVKAEATALEQRSGLTVRCVTTGAAARARLPPEVELALFRICQEALHNIERHARARTATVRLAVDADAARLVVADDGSGIADLPGTGELISSGRLGIIGMRERANLIGATCTLTAPASGGTRVEVVVPVTPRA